MSVRVGTWLAVSSLCCLVSPAQDDEVYEWTSPDGKYRTQAALVRSETTYVFRGDDGKETQFRDNQLVRTETSGYVLRKNDGKEIVVPCDRLSPESQKLAERLLATRLGLGISVQQVEGALQGAKFSRSPKTTSEVYQCRVGAVAVTLSGAADDLDAIVIIGSLSVPSIAGETLAVLDQIRSVATPHWESLQAKRWFTRAIEHVGDDIDVTVWRKEGVRIVVTAAPTQDGPLHVIRFQAE